MDREALQRIVDESAFTREYGLIVVEAGDGRALVEAPFRDHYVRPGGVVPGFIYMAVADITMWFACLTLLAEAGDLAVTTEMRTVFLGAMRGESFWCDARVLDVGGQLLFGTASCRDAGGTLLTHHALTYIHPPLQRPEQTASYQRRRNETSS